MDFYVWKKGEDITFTEHFKSKEFECQCSHADCIDQKISKKLIENLEKCRQEYKHAVIINSGYRCAKHNKEIGGADKSQHMEGKAADTRPKLLTTDTMDEWIKVLNSTFKAMGIAQSFIHVDVREMEGSIRKVWYY
jgi:uncharacterized protein YcbK (DUF882 family)